MFLLPFLIWVIREYFPFPFALFFSLAFTEEGGWVSEKTTV
jgi:hypothetical protein